MATRYCALLLLLLIPAPSWAADFYASIGLLYSQEEAHVEGSADDAIEDCCGWVTKTGKGDYTTGGDNTATGGRIAIGAVTDAGTFEIGWANLGTWGMHIDGGAVATAERRATAIYGAGVWTVFRRGRFSVEAVGGIHNASVSVRVRNTISGAPGKVRVDDTSNGYLYGLRASFQQWSLDVTQWKDVGVEHTTGKLNPLTVGLSYRFDF